MDKHSEKSNIGLRHLRAVLAIAAERSFAAAAARLSVAPSALTETIKQVERATGVALFDRKSRPVSPTATGRDFIADCERIVSLHDAALASLRRIGGIERGNVTIAAAPSLIDRLLAPAIKSFSSQHPDITITVIDEVAGRIEAIVLNEEADFGIAALWKLDTELDALKIGQDRLGLVCHASHAFAGRQSLRVDEIDPVEIISLLPSTGIAQMLEAAQTIPRQLLSGRLQAHSTIAQLLLVKHNLGVALLPELAAGVLGMDQLVFVPLQKTVIDRKLYVLTRPKRHLSPSALALIEAVRISSKQAGFER